MFKLFFRKILLFRLTLINSDIYKLIVSKNYTLVNMLHSDLVFVNNKFRD